MFIGHYAPAFIAAAHPKAPRLGVLMVAAQLVDIFFFTFVLGGVEAMKIAPHITVTNSMDLYHMPYTHSLLGSIAFGLIATMIIWGMEQYSTITVMPKARVAGNGTTVIIWTRAAAFITAAVVVSHWFLDLLVHHPDLTLMGSPPKLGLALWNYPMIEWPLEILLTGGSLLYYLHRTHAIKDATLMPAWILGGLLMVVQFYNWLAPAPTVMNASLPITALIAYALFTWAACRLDRTRIHIL